MPRLGVTQYYGLLVCILSACQPETPLLPQADLPLKVYLSPVDSMWLRQRQPTLSVETREGHKLHRVLSEADLEGDTIVLSLRDVWRGPLTFSLTYLSGHTSAPHLAQDVHITHRRTFTENLERSYYASALQRDRLRGDDDPSKIWLSPPCFLGSASRQMWSSLLGLSDRLWWPDDTPSAADVQVRRLLDQVWSSNADLIDQSASNATAAWDMLTTLTALYTQAPNDPSAQEELSVWGAQAQQLAYHHLEGTSLSVTTARVLKVLPCSLLYLAVELDSEITERCEERRDDGPYIALIEPHEGLRGTPDHEDELTVVIYSPSGTEIDSAEAHRVSDIGELVSIELRDAEIGEHVTSTAAELDALDIPSAVFSLPLKWIEVNRPQVDLLVSARDARRHEHLLSKRLNFQNAPRAQLSGVISLVDIPGAGIVSAAPLFDMIKSGRTSLFGPPESALYPESIARDHFNVGTDLVMWTTEVTEEGNFQLMIDGHRGPLWVEFKPHQTRSSEHQTLSVLFDTQEASPDLSQTPQFMLWISPLSHFSTWLGLRSQTRTSQDITLRTTQITQATLRYNWRLGSLVGTPYAHLLKTSLREVETDGERADYLDNLHVQRQRLEQCLGVLQNILGVEAEDFYTSHRLEPWAEFQDREEIDSNTAAKAISIWARLLFQSCHASSLAQGQPFNVQRFLADQAIALLLGVSEQTDIYLKSVINVTRAEGVWARSEDEHQWWVDAGISDIEISAPRGVSSLAFIPRDEGVSSPSFSPPSTPTGTTQQVGEEIECLWRSAAPFDPQPDQIFGYDIDWSQGAWRRLSSMASSLVWDELPTAAPLESWVWTSSPDAVVTIPESLSLPLPCSVNLSALLNPESSDFDGLILTRLWGVRSAEGSTSSPLAPHRDLTELTTNHLKLSLDLTPPVLYSGDVERALTWSELTFPSSETQRAERHPHYFSSDPQWVRSELNLTWRTSEASVCRFASDPETLTSRVELSAGERGVALPIPLELEINHQDLFNKDWVPFGDQAPSASPDGEARSFTRYSRAPDQEVRSSVFTGHQRWSATVTPLQMDTSVGYALCRDAIGRGGVTPVALTIDHAPPNLEMISFSGVDERILSHNEIDPIAHVDPDHLSRVIDLADFNPEEEGPPRLRWYRWSTHWRHCPEVCREELNALTLSAKVSDDVWRSTTLSVSLQGRLILSSNGVELEESAMEHSLTVQEGGLVNTNLYDLLSARYPQLLPDLGEVLTWEAKIVVSDPLRNQHERYFTLDMHSIPPLPRIRYEEPTPEISPSVAQGHWEPLYEGDLGRLAIANPHDEDLIIKLIPPTLNMSMQYSVQDYGLDLSATPEIVNQTCLSPAGGIPRSNWRLTGFTSIFDLEDTLCVPIPPSPPSNAYVQISGVNQWRDPSPLLDDGIALGPEEQLNLNMPRLDLAYPEYIRDHISPPYEEPTRQQPSTARHMIFEEGSIYLSPYYVGCEGPCEPERLIIGNRSSALDRFAISERLSSAVTSQINRYTPEVRSQLQQSTWYLQITADQLQEQREVKSLLIPISLSIETTYEASSGE